MAGIAAREARDRENRLPACAGPCTTAKRDQTFLGVNHLPSIRFQAVKIPVTFLAGSAAQKRTVFLQA
jgi:hypothetical protein